MKKKKESKAKLVLSSKKITPLQSKENGAALGGHVVTKVGSYCLSKCWTVCPID